MIFKKRSIFEPRIRPFEKPTSTLMGIKSTNLLTRYEQIEKLRR